MRSAATRASPLFHASANCFMWSRNSAGVRVRALGEFSLNCLAVDHTTQVNEAARKRTTTQTSLRAVFMTLSLGEFAPSKFRLIELCSQGVEAALVCGKFGSSPST